jgi:hypothetical protein
MIKRFKLVHPLALSVLLSFLALGALQAAGLKTQTNREGSVTVKVTPGNLSSTATSWDFEVTISSHTTELDQDMQSVAVLVADASDAQPPLAWNGDPPGGHHRKGILRFQPPQESPSSVELHIRGIGGVSRRVFLWRLGE